MILYLFLLCLAQVRQLSLEPSCRTVCKITAEFKSGSDFPSKYFYCPSEKSLHFIVIILIFLRNELLLYGSHHVWSWATTKSLYHAAILANRTDPKILLKVKAHRHRF